MRDFDKLSFLNFAVLEEHDRKGSVVAGLARKVNLVGAFGTCPEGLAVLVALRKGEVMDSLAFEALLARYEDSDL